MLCAVCPQAFSVVFESAVRKAEPDEDLKQRVLNLIDNITSSVFQYTTRGLFECDKLTYIAQLAFQVGKRGQFHLLRGLFSRACFAVEPAVPENRGPVGI